MSYLALYRKYRPDTFDKVYGQKHPVEALRSQVINKRIAHAYLFSGPRGTGKTTVAKIFARAINCENPVNGNPCGNCPSCMSSINGNNVDITEIDAASNNGVDNIRALIDEARYKPLNGGYKVFIIDEVHMLSQSAYNALLKTLEEPPEGVVFILATTELRKVPATVYSRCQHHNFMMITAEAMKDAMRYILHQEQQDFDEEALDYIVRLANGGLRDAISLLDQVVSLQNDVLSLKTVKECFGDVEEDVLQTMVDAINDRDSGKAFEILDNQIAKGRDLPTFCSKLYAYYKDMFMFNQKDASLQRCMEILGELEEKLQWNKSRTLIEVAILKLCSPLMSNDFSSLTARIQDLETMVKSCFSNISLVGTPFSLPESTEVKPVPVQAQPVVQNIQQQPITIQAEPVAVPQKEEICYTIVSHPFPERRVFYV